MSPVGAMKPVISLGKAECGQRIGERNVVELDTPALPEVERHLGIPLPLRHYGSGMIVDTVPEAHARARTKKRGGSRPPLPDTRCCPVLLLHFSAALHLRVLLAFFCGG